MQPHLMFVRLGMLLVLPQLPIYAQNNKAEQALAIAEIKKMGGKVEVNGISPPRPVIAVDLSHTKLIDASLKHLKVLTKLQKLLLENTPVTDDGIVHVKGLTDLEVLELGRTKVTDKGLVNLEGFTKLKRLNLAGTKVTDRGLAHLEGLRQLQTLDLTGTRVTAAGVQNLQRALPNVKIDHSPFRP